MYRALCIASFFPLHKTAPILVERANIFLTRCILTELRTDSELVRECQTSRNSDRTVYMELL